MANGNLVRLGGIFGILAMVTRIPGLVVGYPDSPGSSAQAGFYFAIGNGAFVLLNGVLLLLSIFFLVLFVGVLYEVLRGAEDGAHRGGGLPAAALAGGIVFATLSAAGTAVEILYPAVLQRFGSLQPDAAFVLVSLTLSSWLYHFCQIGDSVMVLSTSVVALGTGILPRWMALAGFVVALLALLHFLLPLLGVLAGMAWVVAVSVVMLTGGVASTGGSRIRRARS